MNPYNARERLYLAAVSLLMASVGAYLVYEVAVKLLIPTVRAIP